MTGSASSIRFERWVDHEPEDEGRVAPVGGWPGAATQDFASDCREVGAQVVS